MPKVLNVGKLEKKFQTLSRSRESIQGLSLWIMNHKEVYQDIVDQWLIGVSNKVNTLAMFYVANEVIQGCGKKRCPEFREAFSKAIEKAASFENVKEIKKDVIRLLTLWKERNIYDEEFNQMIEIKLNHSSVEELSEDDEEDEKEEEELPEIEIIKQFKRENLIDKLKSVKSLESEIKENEDILNYADVPEMPDIDDIIVRRDCQDRMKKCDKYLAFIRESTELVRKEIRLRKKLLKELKNSCVFYTAQQRDVKEVYNAFRVYGKRVKFMETRLSEKMTTLPFVDSPCFSEDNMSTSTSNFFSPNDPDASIASKSPLGASPVLLDPPSPSYRSPSNVTQQFSFSGKFTKESVSELLESIKQVSQKKSTDQSPVSELSASNLEQTSDSVKDDQLHKHPFSDKPSSLSEESINIENKKESINFHDESINCEKKVCDASVKEIDFIEQIKNYQEQASKQISSKKESSPEIDTKSSSNKEEKDSSVRDMSAEVKTESIFDKEKSSALQSKVSDQREQSEKTSKQDAEDVDFLLDESYDNKKTKINISYKRKIEFLLKSKGKKPCTEPSSEELPEKVHVKKDSPKCEMDVKLKSEIKDDLGSAEIESRQIEISKDGSSEALSSKIEGREENDSLNFSERKTDSLIGSLSNIHSENSVDAHSTFADSGLCHEDSTKPKEDTSLFNLSGTFTGSALSSFMSGMSTDFLRNILQTNQRELRTESRDDSDQKVFAEVESNSPSEKIHSNILHDLKASDVPKEESSENDSIVMLAKADEISETTKTAMTSAIVKEESSALSQDKPKLALPETDITTDSGISDELKSVSNIEVPSLSIEKVEEILPSDSIQDISSKSISVSNNDELVNNKTNLIETLHSVLECLSNNMSGRDVKSLSAENCPELEPPLSLENCMKIYKYLHGDCSTFKTGSSCTEINSEVKVASVATDNNYGVMDMECDSEEEV